MPFNTQTLTLDDYSGGFTDYYVDAPINRYQKADNLLVTVNKKLESRPGSALLDTTNPQIPPGAQRIGALIPFEGIFFVQSAKNFYYLTTSWQTLTGPGSNPVFGAGTVLNYISSALWNHHLFAVSDSFSNPVKIFYDNTTLNLRTAGLPKLASPPVVTAGAPGAGSYVYAFLYDYIYQVGPTGEAITYEDFSSVTEVGLSSASPPDIDPVEITAIPVISNGATDNYDTANIKVGVYRTTDGGIDFFKVGEVTNGTTTFEDTMSDADLINQLAIYTSGGVVQNDPPPPAKFFHVVNRIGYYLHVKEGSEVFTNRIRQSVPNDLDSCPEEFFDDVEDEIAGVSSTNGVLVVFGKNRLYRLEGFYDELGRGGMTHQEISSTTGCVSNQGIVQIPQGIVFPGTDGFYFTDGYQAFKISDEWNATYKTLIATEAQGKRIHGAYDRRLNRVWWSVQSDASSLDNDSCKILDIRWGLKRDACFTSASGDESFAPTALLFHGEQFYRADRRGYLLNHDPALLSDSKIDTTLTPSNWNTQPIIYSFKSSATNFGYPDVRSWVSKLIITCANITNLSLQINSINDDSGFEKALVPIRFRGNCFWGDPEPIWGADTLVWNFNGLIEEQRHFKSGTLRCSYKQVVLTNAYTVITNSDIRGLATISNSGNTAFLLATDITWPDGAIGYFISFENDSYTRQYEIIDRTDDTLTFLDPINDAPDGNQKWEIKGYAKDELIRVLKLSILYMPFSDSQEHFTGAGTGANA